MSIDLVKRLATFVVEGNNTSAKTQTGEKCEKSCCEKEGKTK